MSGDQPPRDEDRQEGGHDQQPPGDQPSGGSQQQPQQGGAGQQDQQPGTPQGGGTQQPGTPQGGGTQQPGTGGTQQRSAGTPGTGPAGTAQAGTGESVGDLLGRETVQDRMKFVVGAYALLSIGIGFAGYIAIDQFPRIGQQPANALGAGLVGPILVILGPVLAVVFAARLDEQMEVNQQGVIAASFVSNAAGHFVLLLIGTMLVLAAANPGYDLLGDYLAPYLIGAIVTGAVGAGGVWLRDWAL